MGISTDRGGKRRYSDEERAAALAALTANGGNQELTSRQLGIPRHTLRHWYYGERHPEARARAEGKTDELANELEEAAFKILSFMPARMESASLQQLAVCLGITVDKMQILRNRPTTINGVDDGMSDEELERRIQETEARIAALAAGERETAPETSEDTLPTRSQPPLDEVHR